MHFDLVEERRLRTKIDFYVIPTVALLYMFCFIDRANIGERCLCLAPLDLLANIPLPD